MQSFGFTKKAPKAVKVAVQHDEAKEENVEYLTGVNDQGLEVANAKKVEESVKALRSGHKIKTQNGVYTITGMGSQTNATKDFEATNEKGEKFNLRVSLRGARGIQVAAAPSLNFPEKEEMLESIVNESVNEAQFKVGDNVIVMRKDGKEYTGKVEKLNPLKLRISPSDTMVIPNAYIKDIVVNEAAGKPGMWA